MSTRIRYIKQMDGNLKTKEPILVGGDLMTVTLAPGALSYVITNATNGDVIAQDNAISMQMLKIKVKKELRSRGAVFNDEVRTRGPAS